MDSLVHSNAILAYTALAFTLAVLVWLSYRKYAVSETSRIVLWAGLGVYLLAFMIGCFRQGETVTEPALYTGTLILISICLGMLSSRLCARAETAISVLAVVAGGQAAIALWQYMHSGPLSALPRAEGTLGSSKDLGFIMGVCIPLTAVLVATIKNSLQVLLMALVIAGMFAALLLTMNYEVIAGLFMACIWVFATQLKRHRPAALIGLALLNLSIVAFPTSRDFLLRHLPVDGAAIQENAWHRGMRMSEHNWEAGIGAGSSGDVINSLSQKS